MAWIGGFCFRAELFVRGMPLPHCCPCGVPCPLRPCQAKDVAVCCT